VHSQPLTMTVGALTATHRHSQLTPPAATPCHLWLQVTCPETQKAIAECRHAVSGQAKESALQRIQQLLSRSQVASLNSSWFSDVSSCKNLSRERFSDTGELLQVDSHQSGTNLSATPIHSQTLTVTVGALTSAHGGTHRHCECSQMTS